MTLRTSGAWTLGLVVALSLGAAAAAAAQADTAKGRVPVRKEKPTMPAPSGVPVAKEPVAPRPDTTPRMAAGEVVTQKDTAAPAPVYTPPPAAPIQAPVQMQPRAKVTRYLFGNSGFYIGLGAGTAVPYNVLSDMGYDSGLDLTVPIGWHRPGRTLGVRATLAFDQVHADPGGALPALSGSGPDPKIYSGTVDAVLKFPIGRMAREGRGLSLYTVGGGGVYLFRGFGGASWLGDVLGDDEVGDSKKNVHKWGIQAGAGLEWGLGPAAVFVESRWVNVFTSGSRSGNDYLRWIPIAAGVTLR